MTKDEVLAFLNANPLCHLATVEGDKPHVRSIELYKADENGIIFHTSKTKDLCKQLQKNPNVEMCFNKQGVQLRVSGKVEVVEDVALKQGMVTKWAFLKPLVEAKGLDILVVYRLSNGLATVWTIKEESKPKNYIQL